MPDASPSCLLLQLLGFILATAIPLIASIGPIRSALSRSLRDALDVHRAKSVAVWAT